MLKIWKVQFAEKKQAVFSFYYLFTFFENIFLSHNGHASNHYFLFAVENWSSCKEEILMHFQQKE